MTASDHATKPLRNTLRERGHPYITLGASDAGCDAPDDAGRLALCDGMRQQGAMKISITRSPAAGLNFVGVERREQALTVTVDSRQPTFCPECGAQSKSRHSTYWRTLRDLSAQGAPVIVNACLGRWRCRNQLCDRRIFTERVPSFAAPFARRTASLAGIVRLLGHSAGGRPSERLMRRLGMPVSDTTILAGMRKHARTRSESSAVAAVHVAGVDDWAWRKGSNYGTIIVDLEHRVVVDVLADRSAATTASWFKDHPEVEMVSRDRAGLYAEAAREGAPQATRRRATRRAQGCGEPSLSSPTKRPLGSGLEFREETPKEGMCEASAAQHNCGTAAQQLRASVLAKPDGRHPISRTIARRPSALSSRPQAEAARTSDTLRGSRGRRGRSPATA